MAGEAQSMRHREHEHSLETNHKFLQEKKQIMNQTQNDMNAMKSRFENDKIKYTFIDY